MAVSMVLTAFFLAGGRFDTVSVLGAQLKFERPEALFAIAWVVWGYFLLRYLQYLREEKTLGIAEIVAAERLSLAIRLRKLDPVQDYTGQVLDYKLTRVGWRTWAITVDRYQPSKGASVEEERGRLGIHVYVGLTFLGVVEAFLYTHKFTDYLVPILVALAAPVVAALS